MASLTPSKEQRLKERIKRAYDFFDKDGTGSVIQEYVTPCWSRSLVTLSPVRLATIIAWRHRSAVSYPPNLLLPSMTSLTHTIYATIHVYREASTIMRYLGTCPSEKELVEQIVAGCSTSIVTILVVVCFACCCDF